MSDKKLNFVESVLFRCFLHTFIKIRIDNKLRFWDKNYVKVHTISSLEEIFVDDGFKLTIYPRIVMKLLWKYNPKTIEKIQPFKVESYSIIDKKVVDRLKRNNIKLKFDIDYSLTKNEAAINIFCKKDKVHKLKLMGIFD